MGKDLKGKELGIGIRQRKDGNYEVRALINGININLYDSKLSNLREEFKQAKLLAIQSINAKYDLLTLDEWFEQWFTRYKVPRLKEQSVYPMKNKYYNTFGKQIGHYKVKAIRNIDIQEVINTLQSEGRATSSMRDALGRVRECLEAAKNNSIIMVNPCFDICVPWEKTNKERRFLSKEEQDMFLEEAEFSWYKEMFYIMFLTGLRIGEVGALKWSDVDFTNRCINVRSSLSCVYEKGVKKLRITTPKTCNSYRRIPFMGEAEEMLLSQKNKQNELKKQLGERYRSEGEFDDLVFVTSMGSPVLRYSAEKEIKKIVKALNEKEVYFSAQEHRAPVLFENVYPHAIRHTFCSRCFENGMNPKVVQALMGHQHYSTTIDIYTHISKELYEDETIKYGNAANCSFYGGLQ